MGLGEDWTQQKSEAATSDTGEQKISQVKQREERTESRWEHRRPVWQDQRSKVRVIEVPEGKKQENEAGKKKH